MKKWLVSLLLAVTIFALTGCTVGDANLFLVSKEHVEQRRVGFFVKRNGEFYSVNCGVMAGSAKSAGVGYYNYSGGPGDSTDNWGDDIIYTPSWVPNPNTNSDWFRYVISVPDIDPLKVKAGEEIINSGEMTELTLIKLEFAGYTIPMIRARHDREAISINDAGVVEDDHSVADLVDVSVYKGDKTVEFPELFSLNKGDSYNVRGKLKSDEVTEYSVTLKATARVYYVVRDDHDYLVTVRLRFYDYDENGYHVFNTSSLEPGFYYVLPANQRGGIIEITE